MRRPLSVLSLHAVLASFALQAAAGAQQFRELRPLPGNNGPFGFAVAVHDVDGDGDPDLLLAPWSGPVALHVFRNDAGVFDELAGASPSVNAFPDDMDVADIDGDGDADVAITDFVSDARLLVNDGTGRFTDASSLLPSVGRLTTVAFADVDGDGDPDLLAARDGDRPVVMVNRGGDFRSSVQVMPPLAGTGRRIRVFDANGDAWPDAFVATTDGDALWINDGRGALRDASANLPVDARDTRDAKVGDVDGDGDPDLVLAGGGQRVWLNDGSGVFTDRGAGSFPPDPRSVMSIALGDVDADSDLDVVVGRWSDADATLFLNDGTGAFVEAPGRLPSDVPAANRHLAITDLDRDGDPDLLVGNQWTGFGRSPAQVWMNLHRHAHVGTEAHIGGEYRVDLFSRPGYGDVFAVAVPLIATGRGELPIPPFGTLLLDPATMVDEAPVYLPPRIGTGQLVLPVPAEPGLVGVDFWTQAVVLTPGGETRLTNLTGARIQG